MTLDKTLQKIIQRAEFDRKEVIRRSETLLVEYKKVIKKGFPEVKLNDQWLAGREAGHYFGIESENAHLLPMIKGLCEEVQRLRGEFERLRAGYMGMFGNQGMTPEMEAWEESPKIIEKALSTSALEKLGGGDE